MCVLVLLVGVLVSGSAAAVDRTLAYGEEGEEPLYLYSDWEDGPDFRLYGWYGVDLEDGETVVSISLWMEYLRPGVTQNDIDDIELAVRYRPGERVAEWSLSPAFTEGEPWDFTTEYGLDELNDLWARIEYTAENATGHENTYVAEGYIPFRTADLEQSLDTFQSNASTVYRGQEIYVNGSTSIVETVNLSWEDADWGKEMAVSGGTFEGWLPLPDGVELGEQELPLTLTTNLGNVFERSVSVNVEIPPPTVSVSVDDTVEEGENLSLSVDASADGGVDRIELVFQGETYASEDGEFVLPTADLAPDGYGYTVSVTDVHGMSTTVEDLVVVVAEEVSAENGDENGDVDVDNGADGEVGETTSVLIAIVDSIRGFFERLIVG